MTLFSLICSSCSTKLLEACALNKQSVWHPLPCGCQKAQAHNLCFPVCNINLLLSAGNQLSHIHKQTQCSMLCYSAHARGSVSPRCTEDQYSPLHPPEGESSFPHQRARTSAPPLSGNLPLHGCQEACLPMVHRGPVLPMVYIHPWENPNEGGTSKNQSTSSPNEWWKEVTC
jgi:hypothetical protein